MLSIAATIACGKEEQANVLAPSVAVNQATAPAAAAARVSNTPSLVGNWVSRDGSGGSTSAYQFAAASISLSSCSNIRLNITSETATQMGGTLSMSCPGGIEASGNIVGQTGRSPIPLTWVGSATQGGVACPFSLSGHGTPLGGEYFRLAYSGATCAGNIDGSDDLRFALTTPAAPGPGPAPAPAPLAVDMVPFGSAIIRNSPLTLPTWPITTKITLVDIGPTGVHLDFSKNNGAGRWPDITPPGWDGPLQWTLGMALNIGGSWYASASVQFWNGLDRSGGPPSQYALNWFYDPGRWAPMTSHQPRPGEQVGFFACAGDCRNNPGGTLSPVKERSNVVVVTMPGSDAGGRFSF
jgi:hypothetical protein